MVPVASVSTTMLSVLTICSCNISITGAACEYRRRFRSRATVRSVRPRGEWSSRSMRVRPNATQRSCDLLDGVGVRRGIADPGDGAATGFGGTPGPELARQMRQVAGHGETSKGPRSTRLVSELL